jgi:DNA-binding phage protein
MKKTAVEWLVDELQICATKQEMDIIDQAKEMEKEQIYKALCRGHNDCGVFTMISECEQYYNETFKSE